MQHLLVACVGALLLVSVAAECRDGACFNSASLKVDIPRGRSLQQGWGGAVTCESTQLQRLCSSCTLCQTLQMHLKECLSSSAAVAAPKR
jgi:hypothetical protein